MDRDRRLWSAFGIATVAVLGTRVPHDSLAWMLAAIALTALVGYLVHERVQDREEDRESVWLALAAIVWLLVPTSSSALLGFVPALVAALAVLGLLHVVYASRGGEAPRLDEPSSSSLPRRDALIVGAVLVGVVAVAELWTLLPDRLGRLYEMQAAAGPLVAFAIVALPLLVAVGVRHLVRERRAVYTEAAQVDDGTEP